MSSEIADEDTKKGGNAPCHSCCNRTEAAGPSEENLPFSKVEWLDLSREVIEEKHKKHMARALENGEFKNLKSLCLHNNAGDIGVRAMLNALQHSGLPSLEKLILWNVSSYDQITAAEEGTDTIANAIANNKMPRLQTLDLTGSLPKLIPPRPWMTVFRDFTNGSLGKGRLGECKNGLLGCFRICTCTLDPPGKRPSTLECCCHMCGNYIYSGNAGVGKIMTALRMSPPRALKVLNLRDNHIRDEGVTDLAQLLSEGVLPLLEEVDLRNNPVGEEGQKRIVRAYLENPLLTASVMLDWSNQILKERASAFREKNLRLEHRLNDPELVGINMEQGKISKSYKWNPDYSICRHSEQKQYRFRMRCQIEPHDHSTCTKEGADPEGIPIKQKHIFSMRGFCPRCCSTPDRSRKLVYREYEEVQEDMSPATSLTVADGNGDERADEPSSLKCCCTFARLVSFRRRQQPTTNDSIADAAPVVPSDPVEVAQTLSNTHEESRPTSPEWLPSLGIQQQQPTADDSIVVTAPPIPPDAVAQNLSATHEASRPTSAVRLPSLEIQQQPTTDDSTADKAQTVPPDPVVARKGRARISVTPGTRRFITAAKYLKQEEEKTSFWAGCVRLPFFKWLWSRKLAKTKRQIDAIRMELLMFADRKPREFQDMFGLTRVLLEDPAGCHYPAYICERCRGQREEPGKTSQTVFEKRFLNISSPAAA